MDNAFDLAQQENYGGAKVATGHIAPTMRQRIAAAVTQAKDKLADVERAKEILDKNPELEELLNIMQRSHF